MIRESLILGTLWYVLGKIWNALARSPLGRGFDAACRWVARQWRESVIVGWFCSPRVLRGETVAPGRVRTRCCSLYQRLRLDRLFAGSIFLQSFVWCSLSVVAAPFAPTMAVLALSLVGCASLLLRLLHERERALSRDPIAAPVLVYAGIYLVGMLTSVDVRGSLLTGVVTLAFILFALALYHAIETKTQLDALTALMVTVGAAVSCYGILQYRFGWGYQSAAWVDEEMFSAIGFRVGSTMENPNMLGQYLTLMIPLGGAKLLSSKGWRRRLYYFACCGVMCVCMILTFSRGAWLGLLFAGVLFFVALEPRLLFLVPLALLALWSVLPDTVVERFASIGNLGDRSTSYRVSIWLGTLAMLRDGYWLTGVGPGTDAFNVVYPFYSYDASVAQHSHNLYLQLICDAGVAELIAFLWLILRFYRALGAALLRGGQERASRLLQIAFASGTLGFLAQAMTDYSFYNYRVMFLFWAYLALGMASARRDALGEGGVFV
ncbi:MAG: O-antigen ligase family protein [Oscillospiraceae bacterium]|nr:O-antigen ligase family protein [Oscillospiraceae bacterium]